MSDPLGLLDTPEKQEADPLGMLDDDPLGLMAEAPQDTSSSDEVEPPPRWSSQTPEAALPSPDTLPPGAMSTPDLQGVRGTPVAPGMATEAPRGGTVATGLQELAEIPVDVARSLPAAGAAAGRGLTGIAESVTDITGDPGGVVKYAKDFWKREQAATTPQDPSMAFKVGQNVFANAPAMAASIFTANPSLGLAWMGATSAGDRRAELRDKGYSPAQATALSIPHGLAEIIGEKYGLDVLMKPAMSYGARALTSTAVDVLGEDVTAALQDALAKVSDRPGMTVGDFLSDLWETTKVSAVSGPAMAGAAQLAHTAAAAAPRTPRDVAKSIVDRARGRTGRPALPSAQPLGATPETGPAGLPEGLEGQEGALEEGPLNVPPGEPRPTPSGGLEAFPGAGLSHEDIFNLDPDGPEIQKPGIAAYRLKHDQLTGLQNRAEFFRKLDRQKTPTVVAQFDLDKFKAINDFFSHEAGDTVLREVGKAVKVLKLDQFIHRTGGEEFEAVGFRDEKHAQLAMEHLTKYLADRTIVFEDTESRETLDWQGVPFSFGIGNGIGKEARTNADIALKQSKQQRATLGYRPEGVELSPLTRLGSKAERVYYERRKAEAERKDNDQRAGAGELPGPLSVRGLDPWAKGNKFAVAPVHVKDFPLLQDLRGIISGMETPGKHLGGNKRSVSGLPDHLKNTGIVMGDVDAISNILKGVQITKKQYEKVREILENHKAGTGQGERVTSIETESAPVSSLNVGDIFYQGGSYRKVVDASPWENTITVEDGDGNKLTFSTDESLQLDKGSVERATEKEDFEMSQEEFLRQQGFVAERKARYGVPEARGKGVSGPQDRTAESGAVPARGRGDLSPDFQLAPPELPSKKAKPKQGGLDLGLSGKDLRAPDRPNVPVGELPLERSTRESAERNKQVGLFDEIEKSKKPISVIGKPAVEVISETIGHYESNVTKISSPEDVAHIVRDIAKSPQEKFVIVVADKGSRVITVLNYSMGSHSASIVHPHSIGRVLNIPDAKQVWFAHNHPSGDTRPSQEDMLLTKRLSQVIAGTSVKYAGHIILGRDTWLELPTESGVRTGATPQLTDKPHKIPIIERRFAKNEPQGRNLMSSTDVREYAEKELPDGGIILVNMKNVPVVKLSLPEDLSRMNGPIQTALMQEAEKANAAAMIMYTPDREFKPSEVSAVRAFAELFGIQYLDAIDTRMSWRDSGAIGGVRETLETPYSGLDDKALDNLIKKAGPGKRNFAQLFEVGRRVYDSGKTTYGNWEFSLKKRLGHAWDSFKKMIKKAWNRLVDIKGAPKKRVAVKAEQVGEKQAEYKKTEAVKEERPKYTSLDEAKAAHRKAVEKALSEGKRVPENVLKEYGLEKTPKTQYAPGPKYEGMRQGGEAVPEGTEKEKPLRREPIIQKLMKNLEAALYEGRVKNKKAGGFYRKEVEEVRSRKKSDLKTVSHEIAHMLDDRIPELKPAYRQYSDELKAISYDKKSVSEGFAEFVRLWMTNKTVAAKKVPAFNDWFSEFVKTSKYGEAITTAQAEMHNWFEQGEVKKLASKIGTQEPVNEVLDSMGDRFRQSITDDLHGVYKMEREQTGKVNPVGQYETARLVRAAYAITDGAIKYGYPVALPNGDHKFVGKGLETILKPVSKDLDNWTYYAVARSANELFLQGRENLITPSEIQAGLALETPEFRKAFDEYQVWNKGILDFAEAKGLINPANRALWRRMEYLPFRREGQKGIGRKAKGVEGNWNGIKMLTGGTGNIRDVLLNMTSNAANLVSEALKNEARVKIADLAEKTKGGARFMVKIPKDTKPTSVDKEQIKRFVYETLGLNPKAVEMGMIQDEGLIKYIAEIEKNFAEHPEFIQFWQMGQAPKGENVVAVLRGGEPDFYEVADPVLYRSLASLNRPAQHWMTQFLGAFKRIGQTTITMTVDFMTANIARDTLSGSIMSRSGFKPFIDSARGMMTRITGIDALKKLPMTRKMRESLERSSQDYKDFIANGGGLASYMLDEGQLRKHLEKFYSKKGINVKTVLDTPAKILYFLEEIADAFEVSTRIGEFKRARKQGESARHAAYLAREVSTDFAMRGDSQVAGFFYDTVMFLRAGVNGMDRLYRGFAHDPNRGNIAMKTGALALMSMALYMLNKDNEDYKDLEDWDKDNYWHFYFKGEHFRYPKIWEIGAVASISERTMEQLFDQEASWKKYPQDVFRITTNLFKLSVIPQALAPPYEQATNRRGFTGAPIEQQWMEDLQPWARAYPQGSRVLQSFGEAERNLPRGLQISPARVQALLQGYFNTWATYGLMLADAAFYDDTPDLRIDDYPGLRRFYAATPAKHTKYETMYYDMLKEATELRRTMRLMDRYPGSKQFADEIELKHAPELANYAQLENLQELLRDKRIGIIEAIKNETMSGKEKRVEIDKLIDEKNKLLKGVITEINQKKEKEK